MRGILSECTPFLGFETIELAAEDRPREVKRIKDCGVTIAKSRFDCDIRLAFIQYGTIYGSCRKS
jgi:hypothetical protein